MARPIPMGRAVLVGRLELEDQRLVQLDYHNAVFGASAGVRGTSCRTYIEVVIVRDCNGVEVEDGHTFYLRRNSGDGGQVDDQFFGEYFHVRRQQTCIV